MAEQGAALRRHFRTSTDCVRLDRDTELALARRWRDEREVKAAQQLVSSHLRFVTVLAAKFRHYHVPVDDLISEGYVGLLTALEKFDPERDIRFATYAGYWVRAKMVDHVLATWSIASAGAGHLRSKLFFKLRRERARAVAQFGEGAASEAALSERLGMSLERIQALLSALDHSDVSLERPVGEGRSETLGDTLPGREVLHDHALDLKRAEARSHSLVSAALAQLDPRERFIATHRLMAPAEEETSLADIGRLLGVTRERARQLESRAKAKLRRHIEQSSRRLGACPRDLLVAA